MSIFLNIVFLLLVFVALVAFTFVFFGKIGKLGRSKKVRRSKRSKHLDNSDVDYSEYQKFASNFSDSVYLDSIKWKLSSEYESKYSEILNGKYVLNKKSGVIHDVSAPSASDVAYHHRKYLTESDAQELIDRGTRYHLKNDP